VTSHTKSSNELQTEAAILLIIKLHLACCTSKCYVSLHPLTCSHARAALVFAASLAHAPLEAAAALGPTGTKFLTEVALIEAGAALLAVPLALAGLIGPGGCVILPL